MSGPGLHALRIDDADALEVLWLGDPRAADAALTGGKAANLSRLASAHRVPPGFVLAVPGTTLERDARAAVALAYRRLAVLTGIDDPPVAVRSSAVDEDGLDASFAGQHDTFLNVSGAEQLWWAISRCVASFGADRALAYRRDAGLPAAPERVAVLVQWLVAAGAAGGGFSAKPLTGAPHEGGGNASLRVGGRGVPGTRAPDAPAVGRPAPHIPA